MQGTITIAHRLVKDDELGLKPDPHGPNVTLIGDFVSSPFLEDEYLLESFSKMDFRFGILPPVAQIVSDIREHTTDGIEASICAPDPVDVGYTAFVCASSGLYYVGGSDKQPTGKVSYPLPKSHGLADHCGHRVKGLQKILMEYISLHRRIRTSATTNPAKDSLEALDRIAEIAVECV